MSELQTGAGAAGAPSAEGVAVSGPGAAPREAPNPNATGAEGFSNLGDVVAHPDFPAVDQALRRGRHVHAEDQPAYAFLLEAHGWLEDFYRRYGCELVHRSDGYFFLLPVSDTFGKRHLSIGEMIVGQGLALAYLDPRSMESGRLIQRDELLSQLASVMGEGALMRALNPKRKRLDERVMQRNVRQKVNEALRKLAQLGFVALEDDDRLRLPPSLMRFAEPVRGLDAPSEALAKLIERGEIAMAPVEGEDEVSPRDGELDEVTEDSDPDAAVEALLAGAATEDAEPYAARDGAGESSSDAVEGGFDLDWDTLPDEEP